jgi:DNA-binding transcriptional ArsR family regulator
MKEIVLKMAEWYKALGDPTRLRLIRLLASHPEKSLCVGALASKLGITQPAVSQHLKVLKHVGLVSPNRDGYRVHYTINVDVLQDYKNKADEMFKLVFEKCACFDDGCDEAAEHHKKPE